MPETSSALVGAVLRVSRNLAAVTRARALAQLPPARHGDRFDRAAATGLPGCGERFLNAAPAADDRSGQGRGDPRSAPPDHRAGTTARANTSVWAPSSVSSSSKQVREKAPQRGLNTAQSSGPSRCGHPAGSTSGSSPGGACGDDLGGGEFAARCARRGDPHTQLQQPLADQIGVAAAARPEPRSSLRCGSCRQWDAGPSRGHALGPAGRSEAGE